MQFLIVPQALQSRLRFVIKTAKSSVVLVAFESAGTEPEPVVTVAQSAPVDSEQAESSEFYRSAVQLQAVCTDRQSTAFHDPA